MHHGAYLDLRFRLRAAVAFAADDTAGVQIHTNLEHHLDNLVLRQSSIASIGHLFVSRLVAEVPNTHLPCSPAVVRLGQEAFKWCMEHADWTSAAWLACMPGLDISLHESVHPHPAVLHAMVCNDSMDWPVVYMQALTSDDLVRQALDHDNTLHPVELNEESLSKLSGVYARQMRKGCFMGTSAALCTVFAVSSWLQLHDPETFPTAMKLRHAHPEASRLTQMLQNQWCVDQFWLTRDTSHLAALVLLDDFPQQQWFWFLSARSYAHKDTQALPAIALWDAWWASQHRPFWETANLWYEMQGDDPNTWNKFERLLAVKSALELLAQPVQESCELPEEYLEIPPVGA